MVVDIEQFHHARYPDPIIYSNNHKHYIIILMHYPPTHLCESSKKALSELFLSMPGALLLLCSQNSIFRREDLYHLTQNAESSKIDLKPDTHQQEVRTDIRKHQTYIIGTILKSGKTTVRSGGFRLVHDEIHYDRPLRQDPRAKPINIYTELTKRHTNTIEDSNPPIDASAGSYPISDYLNWILEDQCKMPILGLGAGRFSVALKDGFVPLFGHQRHHLSSSDEAIWSRLDLQIDRSKKFAIEKIFETTASPSIILFGEPGNGKTIALLRIISLIVENGPKNIGLPDLIVPIFLPLKLLKAWHFGSSEPFLSFAKYSITHMSEGRFSNDFVEHLWATRPLLLCLDGLDEINDSELRSRVAYLISSSVKYDTQNISRIIVTSRYGITEKLKQFQRLMTPVDLLPLDRLQMEELVDKWFHAMCFLNQNTSARSLKIKGNSVVTEILKQASAHNLLEVLVTPMFLSILCMILYQSGEIPPRRNDFFRDCLRLLLRRRLNGTNEIAWDTSDALTVLRRLSFEMQISGERIWPRQQVLKAMQEGIKTISAKLGHTTPNADVFLSWCENVTGVVHRVDSDNIAFLHDSFRLYLAAAYIAQKSERIEGAARTYFGDPFWHDIFVLMVGMVDYDVFEPLLNSLIDLPELDKHQSLLKEVFDEAHAPSLTPVALALGSSQIDTTKKLALLHACGDRGVYCFAESIADLLDDKDETLKDLAETLLQRTLSPLVDSAQISRHSPTRLLISRRRHPEPYLINTLKRYFYDFSLIDFSAFDKHSNREMLFLVETESIQWSLVAKLLLWNYRVVLVCASKGAHIPNIFQTLARADIDDSISLANLESDFLETNDLIKITSGKVTLAEGTPIAQLASSAIGISYSKIDTKPNLLSSNSMPLRIYTEEHTGIRFLLVPQTAFDQDLSSQHAHCERNSYAHFWLSETPITNRQYLHFLGNENYPPPPLIVTRTHGGSHRPVVGVSWRDAKRYCDWLSDISGLNIGLPLEKEWQAAATNGDGRRYPWGNISPSLRYADFGKRPSKGPSRVGMYPAGAGPFGHLDLIGGVWEYCSDLWNPESDDGKYSSQTRLTSRNELWRVIKGGSYTTDSRFLGVERRAGQLISAAYLSIGFRVVIRSPTTVGTTTFVEISDRENLI